MYIDRCNCLWILLSLCIISQLIPFVSTYIVKQSICRNGRCIYKTQKPLSLATPLSHLNANSSDGYFKLSPSDNDDYTNAAIGRRSEVDKPSKQSAEVNDMSDIQDRVLTQLLYSFDNLQRHEIVSIRNNIFDDSINKEKEYPNKDKIIELTLIAEKIQDIANGRTKTNYQYNIEELTDEFRVVCSQIRSYASDYLYDYDEKDAVQIFIENLSNFFDKKKK